MGKAKLSLLLACVAGPAAAIVAHGIALRRARPPRSHGSGSASFRIWGQATGPLYPGGPAVPVDLGFTNPHASAIRITGVAVRIAGTSTAACSASNFAITAQLATARLATARLVPPGASRSLSQLRIPPAYWPQIAMLDAPTSQDACQNATVRLSYAGNATAAVSARTPAGRAHGRVDVDGRPFRRGPVPYGSTVLITPGASLQLRANGGTIALHPPLGRSVRFTVHRAFVTLPYRVTSASVRRRFQLYTELVLIGGGPGRCATRGRGPARSASPLPARGLWARGSGRVRVRGRAGAATARGGSWLTQDRCDGTLVAVSESSVRVFDIARNRVLFLGAGHTYLARPPAGAAAKPAAKMRAGGGR